MTKIPDIFQTEIYGSKEYRNMHKVRMEFPILIDVEPTNACNLDCIFCARQAMKRPNVVMPIETLKTIVDEMKNYKTSIRFSGWGEPTLNPKIVDFVKYPRDNGVLTHLTTNATFLTPELSRSLLKTGLNKIKFSLQGLTENEYNRMRRTKKDSDSETGYKNVVKNIETFIELRNELEIPCHIQVSVSMLKNEQENRTLQQSFYDKWNPKVDSIWGLGKIGVYGGKPLLTSFQRVKDLGRISDEDLRQSRPRREDDVNKGKKCTELYNKISIGAEGVIKACCDDYDNQLAVGKIGKNTIKDVWDGEKLRNLRENIESGDPAKVPPFCKNCDNYL